MPEGRCRGLPLLAEATRFCIIFLLIRCADEPFLIRNYCFCIGFDEFDAPAWEIESKVDILRCESEN